MSATDQAETTPEPPVLTEKHAQPPARRGGGFTLFVALLAFIMGGAACGWLGYQYWLTQQQGGSQETPWSDDLASTRQAMQRAMDSNREDTQARLRQQLDTLGSQLRESLKQQQLTVETGLQNQSLRLDNQSARLAATENRLNEAVRLHRDDWILAEAQYLLRLARQRAQFGDDMQQVNSLFDEARRNLNMVQDKRASQVIEVLERDQQSIQHYLAFDLSELQEALDAVTTAALTLQPLADRKVKAKPQAETPEPPPALAWDTLWPLIQYGFARAADKLDSYIRVSDRDASYQQAVIAGGQRELFQENLRLMFEQAQWALVTGNETLYRHALARCTDWLRRYYRSGDTEQALLAEIESLSQRAIRPATPPLSASIAALSTLIDQRHAGDTP